jgi:hypothetical protein
MADSMRNGSGEHAEHESGFGILDRILELTGQSISGYTISKALGLEPELYQAAE